MRRYIKMATSALRPLPDYILIGAQKGGTNFINDYLSAHPHCRPTPERQINFFDSPRFKQGVMWYRSHFPVLLDRFYSKSPTITGDYCPTYLLHPHTPRRIAQVIPQAKLLVTLRNPVDRAYSMYQMKRRKNVEPLDTFEAAVDAEEERLKGEFEKMLADEYYHGTPFFRYSYLLRGKYIEQLERYAEYFPRDQILVFKSEDMFEKSAEVYKRMQEFLGLSDWQPPAFAPVNKGEYSDMKPETRSRLNEYFAPFNQRLYEYLGEDFGW